MNITWWHRFSARTSDFRAAPGECHVALLGVDNLPTRRLTSGAGWTLAIDTGLGDQPGNFDSILIHRFPGSRRSDEIPAWQPRQPHAVAIPQTAAFADLQEHRDPCGVTELAGKAAGAAFVGVTAACLAIAEAVRELHGGTGHDTLLLSLTTTAARTSPAGQTVLVASARLRRDYARRMRPTQSGPACAHGRPRAVCRRPGPRPSRRRILAGQRRNIPGVYLWRTQVGPGGCLCRERGRPSRSAPCTAQARLAETPSWPCSSSCQRG
jgi:hypothetical protein